MSAPISERLVRKGRDLNAEDKSDRPLSVDERRQLLAPCASHPSLPIPAYVLPACPHSLARPLLQQLSHQTRRLLT